MHANVKTILGTNEIMQSCRKQVLMRLVRLGDGCDFQEPLYPFNRLRLFRP